MIDTLFAPAIKGMSLLAGERVRETLSRTVGNPTAKAAIDVAIWDAWGKTVGQPVHELLGGYTDHLRVSHMLGFDDPSTVADEATRIREEFGITSFKIKVGRRPIDLDIAVCRAIREAVGEQTELYLDRNRGWPPSEAVAAVRRLADLGLSDYLDV